MGNQSEVSTKYMPWRPGPCCREARNLWLRLLARGRTVTRFPIPRWTQTALEKHSLSLKQISLMESESQPFGGLGGHRVQLPLQERTETSQGHSSPLGSLDSQEEGLWESFPQQTSRESRGASWWKHRYPLTWQRSHTPPLWVSDTRGGLDSSHPPTHIHPHPLSGEDLSRGWSEAQRDGHPARLPGGKNLEPTSKKVVYLDWLAGLVKTCRNDHLQF